MTDNAGRTAALRQLLESRRRELRIDVQNRVRDERGGRSRDGRDQLEHADDNSQGDLNFALLQIRTATMTRIDEALVRLDAGKYGSCAQCERAISERRLRALPFAVRCQTCEEQRETEHGQSRRLAQRLQLPPFATVVGP